MASTKDTKIREWRQEQFASMGFNRPMAKLLALSRTDHHKARKMIEQGCAHETLTAIFLDGTEHEEHEQVEETA